MSVPFGGKRAMQQQANFIGSGAMRTAKQPRAHGCLKSCMAKWRGGGEAEMWLTTQL